MRCSRWEPPALLPRVPCCLPRFGRLTLQTIVLMTLQTIVWRCGRRYPFRGCGVGSQRKSSNALVLGCCKKGLRCCCALVPQPYDRMVHLPPHCRSGMQALLSSECSPPLPSTPTEMTGALKLEGMGKQTSVLNDNNPNYQQHQDPEQHRPPKMCNPQQQPWHCLGGTGWLRLWLQLLKRWGAVL